MKRYIKVISIFLLVAIVNVSGVFTIYATGTTQSGQALFKEENGKTFLIDAHTGRYLPVKNVEEEFAKITASRPRDVEFERAFLERKEHIRKAKSLSNPTPGGVGYGMFYTDAYKKDYTNGSCILYDIICPTKAGGNVNTWLYLTATNLTAKGVEALISYYGQNDLEFKVYDWARADSDPWQVSIPYSNFGDHLYNKTIHGVSYQVMTLENITELVEGNTWRNIVFVYNPNAGGFNQVYSYSYTSSMEEQQGGWAGSWGPIVETFQDNYANTNVLGFDSTNLVSKDSSGQWGDWQLLSSSQSTIRNDNKGFSQVFLDPNYAFGVH